MKRFLKTDRILPESIALVKETAKPYICLKILNFEAGESNFILRPGQILEIDELQDPRLKTVYCYMKALKGHFEAEVKSYFLKKVLLLPNHLQMAKNPSKDEIDLLFQFLSHPSLKMAFEDKIDYQKWERNLARPEANRHLIPEKEQF